MFASRPASCIFPLVLILLVLPGRGQVDLEGVLKDQAQQLKGKAARKAKEKALAVLEKQKQEYDESNFNYAISFIDNSGAFEAAEKGSAISSALLTLNKLLEGEKKTTRERAYSATRNAEYLMAGNRFVLAEKYLKAARMLYESERDTASADYWQVINDLGLLYLQWGRPEKARSQVRRAFEMQRAGTSRKLKVVALNNYAVLAKELGYSVECENALQQALTLAKEDRDVLAEALINNNLAMNLLDMNRVREAETAMQLAVTEASRALKESSWNYIRLQVNLAAVYRLQKKHLQAENIYLRAIAAKEKRLGAHPDLAHLKRGLAQVYLDQGKPAEAEKLLVSAMEINRRKLGAKHPATASTQQELANLFRFMGSSEKAIGLAAEAAAAKKEAYGEKHPQYAQALEDLALAQWEGKVPAARDNYETVIRATIGYTRDFFQTLSENEKSLYWERTNLRLQRFYSFAAERYQQDSTLTSLAYETLMNTRGFLLDNSLKLRNSINGGNDEALKSAYAQWLETRELLNAAYQRSEAEKKEEGINQDSLLKRAAELERELSQRSAAFRTALNLPVATPDAIRKTLKKEEAVVDLIRLSEYRNGFTGKDRYLGLVARQGGVRLVDIGEASAIEEAIKKFRERTKDLIEDKEVYRAAWKPLDDALAGASALYYCPDGAYHRLSVNGVRDDKGRFLSEKYLIRYLTNTRDILSPAPAGAKPATAILIGNPQFGSAGMIEPLPGAEQEVRKIAKLMGLNKVRFITLTGANATEKKIRELPGPSVLHLATHGYFLPDVSRVEVPRVLGVDLTAAGENPLLRSGLLLANCEDVFSEDYRPTPGENGVLTAYEVQGMDLGKTDLVVLSACETGLGDIRQGEGVYGLQRAFLVAGARTIIMSLWTVSDEATMQLMTNFYMYYLRTGNRPEAFAEAMKKLRQKYREPYYWSGFVMLEG